MPARRLSPLAPGVWRLHAALGALGGRAVAGRGRWRCNVDALGAAAVGRAARARRCSGRRCVPPLRWRALALGRARRGDRHPVTARSRSAARWCRGCASSTSTRAAGIFEQSFGLSTVVVHTAAGSHTIPLLAAGRGRGAARRGSRAWRAPTTSRRRARLAAARRADERAPAAPLGGRDLLRRTRCATPPSRCSCIVGVTLLGGAFDGRGAAAARWPTAASACDLGASRACIRYQYDDATRSTTRRSTTTPGC